MAASINMALPKVAKTVISRRSLGIGQICFQNHEAQCFVIKRMYGLPTDVDRWRKTNWKEFQTGRQRVDVPADEEFTRYIIPGHETCRDIIDGEGQRQRRRRRVKRDVNLQPRFQSMQPDQDWTAVWPAAHTFKWSVVPFPVRQGVVKRFENEGIPPAKYANAELLKIPNFLHLTPAHVKKQCAAIKEYCTDWPKGLETEDKCTQNFPVEVITSDYVFDGPSLRDPRARRVTMKIPLSVLKLDEHAKDKMLLLVGDRYDAATDTLTLEADRCPLKKQNTEYVMYLLTALYHESWKQEPWERDITEDDMLTYDWTLTAARNNVLRIMKQMKEIEASSPEENRGSQTLKELPVSPPDDVIEETEPVKEFRKALTDIHTNGEDVHSLNQYKEAAKKLLLGKKA